MKAKGKLSILEGGIPFFKSYMELRSENQQSHQILWLLQLRHSP